MRKSQLKLGSLAISLALLTGCAPTVALEPAADANNPDCAEIIVRLPDEIAGEARRSVNAQSTAAWGDPVSVLLRCGLEPVEVSTLPCVSASEIDWLVDDSNAPSYRFISFATAPATEVIIDSSRLAGVTVLEQLAGSVGVLEPTKRCTEITN
ncbi:unannotated protein [freshwater metagenome]|uniref:Unannotated protein n=1 Tax=freshwater metagenome TaxID=449393 RepID=A0A6J6JH47_9ZZZZ|nr:DUF3515 family protein [Actinomycetota bacterium]